MVRLAATCDLLATFKKGEAMRLLVALGLLCAAGLVSAESIQHRPLVYKGTPFGISEAEFLQRHRGAGFTCRDTGYSPERECKSATATLDNLTLGDTTAAFIANKLVFVSVALPSMLTAPVRAAAVMFMLPDSLEAEFGPPVETRWPEVKPVQNGESTRYMKKWARGEHTLQFTMVVTRFRDGTEYDHHSVVYSWDRWKELEAEVRARTKKPDL